MKDGRSGPGLMALVLPVAVLLASCLCRCGTTASMWPLRRGQSLVGLEAGGPVANISGVQFPVPYPICRYRRGLTDRLGVNAAAHLLMPLFGTAGFDAGASYHFLNQSGWFPCLGFGAGVVGLVEFDGGGGTCFLPTAELTASYLRPGHSLSYMGVHTMYEVSPRFYMTFSPYVGHNFRLRRNLSLSLELKWYAGYERARPRAVIYSLPIANHGGIGFIAGVNYHFGGWYR